MTSPPQHEDSSLNLLDEARRALREGRLDQSQSLAEAALEKHGGARPWETASALALLGEVALRRESPRDALEHLEESFRLAPRPYTASLIVRALYRAGQWEDGALRCRGFLRSFPGDLYLRMQEVYHCFHREEFAKAEDLLQGILADSPDSTMVKSLLVEARTRSSPPAERIKELEDLFRIESRRNDPRLRYLQGRNHMAAGDPKRACQEFAAAVALDPEDKFFRRHLAFALNKAGLHSEAVRALRELLLEDPTDRYVRGALQSACRASGNREAFSETLREALKLHPDKKFLFGLLRKAEGGRGK